MKIINKRGRKKINFIFVTDFSFISLHIENAFECELFITKIAIIKFIYNRKNVINLVKATVFLWSIPVKKNFLWSSFEEVFSFSYFRMTQTESAHINKKCTREIRSGTFSVLNKFRVIDLISTGICWAT